MNKRPGEISGPFGSHPVTLAPSRISEFISLPEHEQILVRYEQEIVFHAVRLPVSGRPAESTAAGYYEGYRETGYHFPFLLVQ